MAVFSPQPLKNDVFLFFRQSKNAQFFQWILKDNDVYFQKITAS